MMEMIKSLVRQEVERVIAAQKPKRLAKVTSYDKKTYSVKVQFWPFDPNKPDDAESGWIPIQAMGTGSGFGIVSAPNIGDMVDVGFEGADHMTARLEQRHFTQNSPAPDDVEAGEHHIIHGMGAVIRLKKDGTVFIGGAGTVPNKQGTGGDSSGTSSSSSSQTKQPQAKQGITLKPDGSFEMDTPNGDFTHNAGKALNLNGKTINIKPGSKLNLG